MLLEHAFGAVGTIMLLVAYFLGSTGRLRVSGGPYQWLNLVAALILLVYSAIFGAWMNVVLEVVWGGIAVNALWREGRRLPRSESS
ncbi:MAG: CBU_0592 family membrane protein [Chloroflexota bacterium]